MKLFGCPKFGWTMSAVLAVSLDVSACARTGARAPDVVAEAVPQPLAGAIRWDAWTGAAPGYDVGLQIERSLSPERWHYRLPFYARQLSSSTVEVRASTQEVMDREIAYAHAAGLAYWAFVMYPPTNPQTRGGLDLCLKSERRNSIRFAMIAQSYTFGDADIDRLVKYFGSGSYQMVAGRRPLVFLVGPTKVDDPDWKDARASVGRLRAKSAAAGFETPYIVHLWGWDQSKAVIDWLGLDAVSAYSLNFNDRGAPYSTLARKAEAKWDDWRATGAAVVPLVTTGWDRRPRVEHPVSWEKPDPAGEIEFYYGPPTPAELRAHLQAAVDWCARYPSTAQSSAILIYAWNENDEGGWLVPSLWPDQANARLEAVGQVLNRPSKH
jgi:hypothetical protein